LYALFLVRRKGSKELAQEEELEEIYFRVRTLCGRMFMRVVLAIDLLFSLTCNRVMIEGAGCAGTAAIRPLCPCYIRGVGSVEAGPLSISWMLKRESSHPSLRAL